MTMSKLQNVMVMNTDPIVSYLLGETDENTVDPKVLEMYRQVRKMEGLRSRYHIRSKVIKIFAAEHPELSESTIYRIWHRMQHVYGSINNLNKDYCRHVLQEILLKAINKAEELEKPEVVARLAKELREVWQLDVEDKIDPTQLGRHTFIIDADPRTIGINPVSISEIEEALKDMDLGKRLSDKILAEAKDVPFINLENDGSK